MPRVARHTTDRASEKPEALKLGGVDPDLARHTSPDAMLQVVYPSILMVHHGDIGVPAHHSFARAMRWSLARAMCGSANAPARTAR